jgi:hypothetical protein
VGRDAEAVVAGGDRRDVAVAERDHHRLRADVAAREPRGVAAVVVALVVLDGDERGEGGDPRERRQRVGPETRVVLELAALQPARWPGLVRRASGIMSIPTSASIAARARSERVSSSQPSAEPVTEARSEVSMAWPRNPGWSPWQISRSEIGANHAAVAIATSRARAAA